MSRPGRLGGRRPRPSGMSVVARSRATAAHPRPAPSKGAQNPRCELRRTGPGPPEAPRQGRLLPRARGGGRTQPTARRTPPRVHPGCRCRIVVDVLLDRRQAGVLELRLGSPSRTAARLGSAAAIVAATMKRLFPTQTCIPVCAQSRSAARAVSAARAFTCMCECESLIACRHGLDDGESVFARPLRRLLAEVGRGGEVFVLEREVTVIPVAIAAPYSSPAASRPTRPCSTIARASGRPRAW